MNLSCCVWALSGPDLDILTKINDIGFQSIDVQPFTFSAQSSRHDISAKRLQVCCVGASFGMPEGTSLDDTDEAPRRTALNHVKHALAYAADMGAAAAYVVPGLNPNKEALKHYAKSLTEAADTAAEFGIRLGVEHFPGRALPTAAGTLEFLAEIGHPNLYLLFDLGHIQMSGEDPVGIIETANDRLGYVHLDDNDGVGDLHWSLLDGVMTIESLASTFKAIQTIDYTGPISLELSPNLPDPLQALKDSYQIVHDIWGN